MGLIRNKETLIKINGYLSHTNFGTQNIGHHLALGFMPPGLAKSLEDKRYTFNLRHRLFSKQKNFQKVTYSEVVVGIIIELTEELVNIPKETLKMYTEFGLIKDKKCTKELISTVIANIIALNPLEHNGNTTTKKKYSDNLQIIFPEFETNHISYFLDKLDKYKPTI